jgi:hypothetical protein
MIIFIKAYSPPLSIVHVLLSIHEYVITVHRRVSLPLFVLLIYICATTLMSLYF